MFCSNAQLICKVHLRTDDPECLSDPHKQQFLCPPHHTAQDLLISSNQLSFLLAFALSIVLTVPYYHDMHLIQNAQLNLLLSPIPNQQPLCCLSHHHNTNNSILVPPLPLYNILFPCVDNSEDLSNAQLDSQPCVMPRVFFSCRFSCMCGSSTDACHRVASTHQHLTLQEIRCTCTTTTASSVHHQARPGPRCVCHPPRLRHHAE